MHRPSALGGVRPAAVSLTAVLAVGAVPLAGCGDPEPEPVENMTIGLRLDEYRVMPQAVLAPHGELRLIIRNRGILPHNVAVKTIPEVGSEEPAQEIARTATVHAGERAEVSFSIEPGTYELVCTIANHDDLGQSGRLIVE